MTPAQRAAVRYAGKCKKAIRPLKLRNSAVCVMYKLDGFFTLIFTDEREKDILDNLPSLIDEDPRVLSVLRLLFSDNPTKHKKGASFWHVV